MCGMCGCGQADGSTLLPEAQQVLRGSGAASQKFPGRLGEHVDSRAGVERHLRIQRGGRAEDRGAAALRREGRSEGWGVGGRLRDRALTFGGTKSHIVISYEELPVTFQPPPVRALEQLICSERARHTQWRAKQAHALYWPNGKSHL